MPKTKAKHVFTITNKQGMLDKIYFKLLELLYFPYPDDVVINKIGDIKKAMEIEVLGREKAKKLEKAFKIVYKEDIYEED